MRRGGKSSCFRIRWRHIFALFLLRIPDYNLRMCKCDELMTALLSLAAIFVLAAFACEERGSFLGFALGFAAGLTGIHGA